MQISKLPPKLWLRKQKQILRKKVTGGKIRTTYEIIISLVGAILAIYAIKLSQQANEIANDNKLQQQQIEKLAEIVVEQSKQTKEAQKQTDKLISLVNSSNDQIDRLANIEVESDATSKSIKKLLSTTLDQVNKSNDLQRLQRKSYITSLENTLLVELSKITPHRGSDAWKKYNKEQQIASLNEIIPVLKSQINNPIILENDSLYLRWHSLLNIARYQLDYLNTDINNISLIKEVDGKIVQGTGVSLIEKDKLDSFKDFVDAYYRFFFYMIKNVLWEKKKIINQRTKFAN